MSLGSSDDAPAAGRRSRYVKILMALGLMAAIGIAATTYDSTLQTDPDDVIDVKHEWLPIGEKAIQDFKQPQSSSNDASSSGGGGGGANANEGGGQEPPPCTTGVVGLLASLFPSLIPPCGPFYLLGLVLSVVVLLTTIGLLYRYRERLAAVGVAAYGWWIDQSEAPDDGDTATWPSEQPANDVQSAWVAMVQRANLERPWTRTPEECARGAVDAGMDSEAVGRITSNFEDVRYGDAPVTDERRRRVREWRQRIEDHRG